MMRSMLVLLLAGIAVTAAKPQLCVPNAFFKMNCNDCTCSPDGQSAACTDMLCPEEANKKSVGFSGSEETFCNPGRTFHLDGGDLCTCNIAGDGAICTLENGRNTKRSIAADNYCSPGTIFTPDNCNICKCNKDGSTALCTLTKCSDNRFPLGSKSNQKLVCEPRTRFNEYCNTCACSDDGTSYACTRMECDKEIWNRDGSLKFKVKSIPKRVCQPGIQFKNYCNTCTCSQDGSAYACTRMQCDHEIWNQDGSLKILLESKTSEPAKRVCQPGTMFKNFCNTCSCAKDGLSFACTRMQCDPEIWNQDGTLKVLTRAASKQVCKPLTQFKNYCNSCTCAADGLSFACTKMQCDKEIWNQDGSLKIKLNSESPKKQVCEPRKSFRDYCNICFCNEEGTGYGCTRMLCDRDVWNQDGTLKIDSSESKMVCEPNARFSDDCNTCICSGDGLSKACTMMGCKNENGHNAARKTESSNSAQVCTPKSVFSPDNCNTCICNAEGTNYACTIRLCQPSPKQAAEEFEEPQQQSKYLAPLYKRGDACTPGQLFYSGCNRCICTSSGHDALCTMMKCDQSEA